MVSQWQYSVYIDTIPNIHTFGTKLTAYQSDNGCVKPRTEWAVAPLIGQAKLIAW